MVPQDSYRSPARAQRFIELKNVGSVEIPGYAAVEVIESSRPEAGGTVIPGGGRTVLHCRLAEVDNPCVTAINGPCEIPVGGSGRPGTLDDPMVALVASEYANSIDVGVKAGSFLLWSGYCGYRIVGDYDATTQTQRVIRAEDCQEQSMIVRATECIYPGYGGTVQIQEWDSDLGCYVDSDDDPIEIIDPMQWILALPDECFRVDRHSRCGVSGGGTYLPSFPFGLTRIVKLKKEDGIVGCGMCGPATVMYRDPEGGGSGARCELAESECIIQACNISYRNLACDADEYAMANIIPGQCCPTAGSGSGGTDCLAVLTPMPRPLFGKATARSSVCGSAGKMDGFETVDVCNDWPFVPAPEDFTNDLALYACGGDELRVVWNNDDCTWDLFNVEHHFIESVMLDIRCKDGSCAIEKNATVQGISVQQCEDCGQTTWTEAIVGECLDVIESIDFSCDSGCADGAINYKRICNFCACGDDPDPDTLPMVTVEVPDGVDVSCSGGASGSGGAGSGDSTGSGVMTTKKFCVFGCAAGDGDDITLPITAVDVTNDTYFRQDGLSLKLDNCRITVCVLGADVDNEWCDTDTVTGTDCDPGSGSGA